MGTQSKLAHTQEAVARHTGEVEQRTDTLALGQGIEQCADERCALLTACHLIAQCEVHLLDLSQVHTQAWAVAGNRQAILQGQGIQGIVGTERSHFATLRSYQQPPFHGDCLGQARRLPGRLARHQACRAQPVPEQVVGQFGIGDLQSPSQVINGRVSQPPLHMVGLQQTIQLAGRKRSDEVPPREVRVITHPGQQCA